MFFAQQMYEADYLVNLHHDTDPRVSVRHGSKTATGNNDFRVNKTVFKWR